MYADDLTDLPYDETLDAMRNYAKEARHVRMPLPAHIRAVVRPEADVDTLAQESAARVQQAITHFGYTWPIEAREWIGELGWRAIERFGGWDYICKNVGDSIDKTTFHAQVREIIKSNIKLEKMGIGNRPIELPGSDRKAIAAPGLSSANEILKTIIGRNDAENI